MSLPLRKRYEIIFLGKNRHEPHFGIKKIAKILNCSTSTVKRWLSRWKTDKYLDDHIREGRPRVTSEAQDNSIVNAALLIDEPTSQKVQHQLQNHSLNVSERTVRRRLHEAGLQYSLPLSKPFLTSKHRQDRLQWATQVQNLDWNKIIATDETTFRLNTVRRMCWELPDHRTVRRTVTHPMKINLWGCMTSKGFGKIICFKENLKSHFLCTQIYQNGLLPTARHYFGRRKD
ncbi:unnamed protein product [Rotaria magnacalcarata]|uniref:Transposase Tc1-like domain-containing protein n=1 Tax=Rotaria magnacalcarata TaxID=392030 RepID=A0A814N2K9_9BILA|nr:unnamed protein product [Rotaria magnacalcarata]CAF4830730.1 unnamed protein product [Rotaria magnacalcarata]